MFPSQFFYSQFFIPDFLSLIYILSFLITCVTLLKNFKKKKKKTTDFSSFYWFISFE